MILTGFKPGSGPASEKGLLFTQDSASLEEAEVYAVGARYINSWAPSLTDIVWSTLQQRQVDWSGGLERLGVA